MSLSATPRGVSVDTFVRVPPSPSSPRVDHCRLDPKLGSGGLGSRVKNWRRDRTLPRTHFRKSRISNKENYSCLVHSSRSSGTEVFVIMNPLFSSTNLLL